MAPSQPIVLTRDCAAIEIPSGKPAILPGGTAMRIMQNLGTSYTVTSPIGAMYRIDAKDSDTLGITAPTQSEPANLPQAAFSDEMVWNQLKTVFDPEIPVNIVDLGLIYSYKVSALEDGGRKIDIKMSMTAPGCGMADVLKADVIAKLRGLPEVKDVQVEVVFDPPWNPSLMSEAAKLQLGFDLDYGMPSSPQLPVYPSSDQGRR